ncbi:MAG: ABC transporter ATP-binding protein [Bdellovibrionota bacterium]
MIIEASGVNKRFGDFNALKDLNLKVQEGECVGLLGPNGAGKSTFIGTLYGVVRRNAGELKVFGFDPATHSKEIKRKLGVVTQDNALDEGLSVMENMQLYAAFVELPRSKQEARISELLRYMQLDNKKHAPIRFLSGGMKRRLTFVRALLSDPELVILDEPTTGLDPAVRHLLWERVLDLRNKGKTILLTTHYMHEAEILCNRIVILNNGSVVDEGSPQKLIQQHTPGFVAIFEENSNTLEKITSYKKSSWTTYNQSKQHCLRAPTLDDLLEFQKTSGLNALQLRPANLEDVFIKLTGEGLGAND